MYKTIRSKLITQLDSLFFQILVKERGKRCQICGRTQNIGTFHILPKGSHPRLRYCRDNCLLACWFPCHQNWHFCYSKAKKIDEKIKELKGDNYEDTLKTREFSMPKHNVTYLNILLESFKKQLEKLNKND